VTTRTLVIESTPVGADITVNGQRVGPTPINVKHEWKDKDVLDIRAKLDDYESASRTISKTEAEAVKEKLPVSFTLAQLARSERVTIDSSAPKSFVRIDGRDVGQTPLMAELRFTRPNATAPWSQFSVQVAKDKYHYAPAGQPPTPIYTEVVTLDRLRSNKPILAPLEPLKYFAGTVRRFRVDAEGIRTVEESAASQIGEIEREPKASSVTQMTDAAPTEPLIETRISPTTDSGNVACSIPVYEKDNPEAVGSSIWLRGAGGRATRMTDGRFFDVEPFVTLDGKWVYFSSNRLGRMTIWRAATTGRGGLQKVTDSPSSMVDFEPSLSPDGSRLAYSSLTPGSSTPQIWLCNPDGTLPTQICEGRNPAWSPDGAKVAYVAKDRVSGIDCIWVMAVDGSNPTRLTNPDANSRNPSWTPDGKIVFACDKGLNDAKQRNFDIWAMAADGGGATQLTVNGSYDSRPVVSADGKFLYFMSNRGAKKERDNSLQIWRMAL
jgi:Tol biopolymer transport system component